MGGEQKAPNPSIKSVTHILKVSTVIPFPKEDPKKDINHVTHHLSSADTSIFFLEFSHFCYKKKYRYRLHFDT